MSILYKKNLNRKYFTPFSVLQLYWQVLLFIFFKRKNNSSETKAPIIKPETSLPSGSTDQEEVKRKPIFDSTHSCIRLLGKFQVKDKEGNDISGRFTPILKSLLLLILLHSQKDERGITIKK